MKKWKANKEDAGLKLVTFLRNKMGGNYSAKSLKRAIEKNLCRVNGVVERFASCTLKAGDLILFKETEEIKDRPMVFKIETDRILFEDEALLIYNKPSGITSDQKGIGALFSRFKLVHRLDKETTGVILFAKSEPIKRSMIALFKAMQVKKQYVALVDGVLKRKSGVVVNCIGKISRQDQPIQWGKVSANQGKKAVTEWKLEAQGKTAALVTCIPITGRTHQIRIHMKELGHPILGDFQYARNFLTRYFPKRCLLHAQSLEFPHPITGAVISVVAPLPSDFEEAKEQVQL